MYIYDTEYLNLIFLTTAWPFIDILLIKSFLNSIHYRSLTLSSGEHEEHAHT